ncbi:MAG TPA: DUF4328 domain-containing protein, partial [Acidimicrobiales bacterium]
MEPVTVRSVGACKVIALIAFLGLLGTNFLATGGAEAPWTPSEQAVVVGLSVAWFGVAVWRMLRVRVVLSTDDIVVENIWRRHRLRWSEVAWVEARTNSDWEGTTWSTVLHLGTGAEVVMTGFPEPHQWGRERAVEALNRFGQLSGVHFGQRQSWSAELTRDTLDHLLRTTDPVPGPVARPISELRPLVELVRDAAVPPVIASNPPVLRPRPLPPPPPTPSPPGAPARPANPPDPALPQAHPTRGLGRSVQGVLLGLVLVGFAGVGLALVARQQVVLDPDHPLDAHDSWRSADDKVAAVLLVGGLLIVVLLVLLSLLTRRAHRTVAALDPQGLRWGASWAGWLWLIPGLTLHVPWLVLDEPRQVAAAWRGGRLEGDSWRGQRCSRLGWWWFAAVALSVVLVVGASGLQPGSLSGSDRVTLAAA